MKEILEILLDALVDSAKLLPFLLVIYLLIEFMETNEKAKHKLTHLLGGKAAPLIGGVAGVVPQCGFSVMAADLYLQNYLKTGTLIAVFVATSDEALPILLSSADGKLALSALFTVLFKVVYAVLLGYLLNAFERKKATVDEENVTESEEGCCHHEMNERPTFWGFVKHPLVHTLKIFLYILGVNVLFGILMHYAEGDLTEFMSKTEFLQPVVTALVGLIPNCGSSVIITGLYTKGIVSFGAMVAGLVSNSGIAMAVLLKDRKHFLRSLKVIGILYVAGVAIGMLLTAFRFAV